MKVGYYPKERLTNEAYHAGPGISKSGWTLISRSLAHFKHYKKKVTDAMILGAAVDMAVFEPELFQERYVIAPEGMPFNKKDGIAFKQQAEAQGKTALTFAKGGHIPGIVEAVRSDKDAARLLAHGMAQVSGYWRDPTWNFLAKCRCDWVTDSQVIVDLKTTTDARMIPFSRIAFADDKRYDFQNVVYCEGMTETSEQATSKRVEHRDFFLIVVEVQPYHDVKIYYFDRQDQLAAMEELAVLKEKYANALETGTWSGYEDAGPEILQPPKWRRVLNEY